MISFQSRKFWKKALCIQNNEEFNSCAIELFNYQVNHVPVYKYFLNLLKTDINSIKTYKEIPFLPVTFFKNQIISDQGEAPEFYFTSSGTTGQETSKHYVPDLSIYDECLLRGFELTYGNPEQYCFLALLPAYLERKGSSLVYMVEKLIKKSGHSDSGFYLYNHEDLKNKLVALEKAGQKTFLIGVTYALLDFFEKYPMKLYNTIVMETGGMKGKRKELVKAQLHDILKQKSGVKTIHSEYGMTELLSQAYSKGEGIFSNPPWMRVLIRDLHDPFKNIENYQTGTIQVIDLANIHSCAFIATQDLGRIRNEDQFEVLGRMDNSEMRGCNLMVE